MSIAVLHQCRIRTAGKPFQLESSSMRRSQCRAGTKLRLGLLGSIWQSTVENSTPQDGKHKTAHVDVTCTLSWLAPIAEKVRHLEIAILPSAGRAASCGLVSCGAVSSSRRLPGTAAAAAARRRSPCAAAPSPWPPQVMPFSGLFQGPCDKVGVLCKRRRRRPKSDRHSL